MDRDKIALTMQDILEKEFKVDARGYRMQEVDQFLDIIIRDYNEYNNKYDYELEYEGPSIEYCKKTVNHLLNLLNIDYEFSKISKRKRAIESRL